MADLNTYVALIAINGPTTVRYTSRNLPAKSDPGWLEHRRQGQKQTVPLINIHGPFEVEGEHGPYERCESGWLGVAKDGEPFAVTDEEYPDAFTPQVS